MENEEVTNQENNQNLEGKNKEETDNNKLNHSYFDRQRQLNLDKWDRNASACGLSEEQKKKGIESGNTIQSINEEDAKFTSLVKSISSIDRSLLSDDEAQGMYMALVESDPVFRIKDDFDGSKLFGKEAGKGRENLDRLLSIYSGVNPKGLFSKEAQRWLERTEQEQTEIAKKGMPSVWEGAKSLILGEDDKEKRARYERYLLKDESAVSYAGLMANLSIAGQKVVSDALKRGELDEEMVSILPQEEKLIAAEAFSVMKPYSEASNWLTQGLAGAWDTTISTFTGAYHYVRNLASRYKIDAIPYVSIDGSVCFYYDIKRKDAAIVESYDDEERVRIALKNANRTKLDKDKLTFAGKIASGVLTSVPYAAAFAHPATASYAVASMVNDSREQLIADGVDADTAEWLSIPIGVIQGAIEKIQWDGVLGKGVTQAQLRNFGIVAISRLLKDSAYKQAGRTAKKMGYDFAKTTLTETIEEVLQQSAQDVGLQAAEGEFNWQKLVESAVDTFEQSLPTTIGFGIAGATGIGPYIGRKLNPGKSSWRDLQEYRGAKITAYNIINAIEDAKSGKLELEGKSEEEQKKIKNDRALRINEEFNKLRKEWFEEKDPDKRLSIIESLGGNKEQSAALNNAFEIDEAYQIDNPFYRIMAGDVEYYGNSKQLIPSIENLGKIMGAIEEVKDEVDEEGNPTGSKRVRIRIADGITVSLSYADASLEDIMRLDQSGQLEVQAMAAYDSMYGKGAYERDKVERPEIVEAFMGMLKVGGFSGVKDIRLKVGGKEYGYDGFIRMNKSGYKLYEIGHEIFHTVYLAAKEKGVLNEEDIAKLKQLFGTTDMKRYDFKEEDAADLFGKYLVDEFTENVPVDIFSKIGKFFNDILNLAFLRKQTYEFSAENLFANIREGNIGAIRQMTGVPIGMAAENSSTHNKGVDGGEPNEDTPIQPKENEPAKESEQTDKEESPIVEPVPAQPEEGKSTDNQTEGAETSKEVEESKPVQPIKPFERRLTPRLFSLYNPEADILSEQNSELLKEYADSCPDVDDLMTQDGKPTQELVDRVTAEIQEYQSKNAKLEPTSTGIGTKVPNDIVTHRTPNENFQFQTRWEWVDLDDVVSSERKEFDQALQPRDRTRKASQLQVMGAVKEGNFDPMLLTHSYLSDGGAPIVDGKNQVISGNGRTMMLRSLDEYGRFDKDYSQKVQAWAKAQGIVLPPEGMKKPVLVQRLLTDNAAEIGKIATLSNRHSISGKGEPEVAEEDASILTPDLMNLYNTGKDGDLLAEENGDFIRTFVERAPDSDTLLSAEGLPTDLLVRRLKNALVSAIIGEHSHRRFLLKTLIENKTVYHLTDIYKGLVASAGTLLKAGYNDKQSLDLTDPIRGALSLYVQYKVAKLTNKKVKLGDYTKASNLFDEKEVGFTEVQELAKLMDAGRFSPVIEEYVRLMRKAPPDSQGNLFGEEPETAMQMLARAERRVVGKEKAPVTIDPESDAAKKPLTSEKKDIATRLSLRMASDAQQQERTRFSLGKGYIGHSMSVNAYEAYQDGKMPKSKWSRQALVDAIAEVDPKKAELCKRIPVAVLRLYALEYAEWHHTSAQYNITPFYQVSEEFVKNLTEEQAESLSKMEVSDKPEARVFKGDFEYIEWVGAGRRKKAVPKKLENVTIEEKGKYYKVYDADGKLLARKMVGSNGTNATDYEEVERRRVMLQQMKQTVLDNTTPEAMEWMGNPSDVDVFGQFTLDRSKYDTSSNGNVYLKGHKPDQYAYFNKQIAVGEKRAALNEAGGYSIEEWDGDKWNRQQNEPETRFSVKPPTKEEIEEARRQYDEVVARYTNADGSKKAGWMKAPNGKPTRLTERQWVQVRTENFKRWFGDWERIAEIEHAIDFVLNGEPVSKLTGSEFQQTGNHDLIDRVDEYFRSIGGVVENGELGGVVVDRESVKSSIGHGIGRAKAAAFAAVPEVIRKGVLFDRQRNWKGRGTNTYVIAAPIRIGSENYVCEAIVEEKAGRKAERRFYLREVNLQSAISDTIKTPTGGASIGNPSRPVRSILAKSAAEINRESVSKVVDENGEPLVVYHGSKETFSVFETDGKNGSKTDGTGAFFSSKRRVAEGYSSSRDEITNEDMAYSEEYGSIYGGVYPVFLNIRNPLVTDCNYNNWDDIYGERWKVTNEDGDIVFAASTEEEAEAWANAPERDGESFSWFEDLNGTTTTDEVVKYDVRGTEKDGAVFRNVKDNGDESHISCDVHVVLDPEQIKLANGNEGTFDRWNPDTRFSISHLYTGSAADYEKPSLNYVGSGYGAQEYGWGLYASNKRGVAEGYAKLVRDFNKRFAYRKEGYPENVYEQTFFTDREPGDESHILDWDSVIPKEQGKWLAAQANKEGIAEKIVESLHGVYDPLVVRNLYDAISEVLGSQKAASEFLARAGIDGVKYEHDGGWNYVSFRDDNIRVDHKWTDGEQRFSLTTGDKERDKVLSDALYRVNKEAKVIRDAMNFVRGSRDEYDYRNYMAAIGNRLTPHVDISGRVVDGYGRTADEIRDEIEGLEDEVNHFEDDPEYKSDIYEDVDEVNRDIVKLNDTLRALSEEERYFEGRPPRIINELRGQQQELYRLKDAVINKLIEMDPNASIDEVHRFAGAGRRLRIDERGEDAPESHYSPLYRFGNHSFHAGTIESENIPERFDKRNIKSLGTISSENELGYDLPLKQAVNTLNEFLLEGGKRGETRFSVNRAERAVREADLVAIHNLTASELKGSLELGGFPMPSIAVTKDSFGHGNFGDVSVLFGRSTVDPAKNPDNRIYSHDADTPSFPNVVNKFDVKSAVKMGKELVKSLKGSVPDELFKRLKNDYELTNSNGMSEALEYADFPSQKLQYNNVLLAIWAYEHGMKVESEDDLENLQSLPASQKGSALRKWIDDLFEEYKKGKYIAVDEEPYYEDGTRKPFSKTHKPVTLKRLVDSMKRRAENGADAWIYPYYSAAKRFKSVDEAISNEGILLREEDSEYAKKVYEFENEFKDLAAELADSTDGDYYGVGIPEASSAIADAWRGIQALDYGKLSRKKQVEAFQQLLSVYIFKPDENLSGRILNLMDRGSVLPTTYFEAKPRRAVKISEAKAVIAPESIDDGIRTALSEKGIPLYTYADKDQSSRFDAVRRAATDTKVRFSVRVNPNLERDVADAANVDHTGGKRVQRRRSIVEFSNTPEILKRIGVPDAKIITEAFVIRKIVEDHNLSVQQIADIPNRYADPVCVFEEGNNYVILTDLQAKTKHSGMKPVMVYLEAYNQDGQKNFIASVYARESDKEAKYLNLARAGKLLYIDKKRATVIGLEEDTSYPLRPLADGGKVLTREKYLRESDAVSMTDSYSEVNKNPSGGEENLRGSVKVQKQYATEDLVVAVIANERRKGKEYGIDKIKADLASLNLDPGKADEVSRRSDEVIDGINRSLKREIDENTVNDRSYIQAATDQAQKKRIIGMSERIGMKAYQKGRYDEREAQKLANQKESIAAQILASAQGFGADAMESRYGFDIIDTVANAEDGRKKKEKEPAQAEEGTEDAVGVPLDKVNPEPAEVPEPEEVPAEKSEMMAEIIERAKNRSDEIEARYQEDEEESDNGKSSQAKEESKPEEGKSGEEDKAGGEVPAEPIPVIKRERLDFKRPSDFLAFVEEIVEAELRENGKIREGESPWSSPVNRRELLNTARRWLQKLAYALCYSHRREIVLNDIEDLINAKSIEGIECGIMNTYEMLQERMIKESRDKLVSKLEKDGNKIAKKGRQFSRNTEETERKVRSEVEYWWRNIKRYFRMNKEKIEEEKTRLDDIIAKRETAAEEDEGYDLLNDRDWTRANDLKAALTQYGGLYYLRPAQIEEISRDILSRLESSKWELEDKRIEDRMKANVISNRLRKAMANPKAEREKKIPEQGLISRFTDSMIGIFSLRIRNLIRYSRGEERRNAERTIQSIEDSIAVASQGFYSYIANNRKAFGEELKRIYGSSEKGIRRLTEPLPERDRISLSKQGVGEINRAWLLQRYAELLQTDDYSVNIAVNKRDGIWRKRFDEVFSRCISPEDLLVMEWIRNWYRTNLQEVNDKVLVPITGIKQYSPGINYFPVKMRQKEREGYDARVKAWTPYPRWLTPRVSNKLDFDERTNILTMWESRMSDSGKAIHYSTLGIGLGRIFLNTDMKKFIIENHGELALRRIREHLMDIISGGRNNTIANSDDETAIADRLRAWQTYLTLSWNYKSAVKQMISTPTFALHSAIGFGDVFRAMADIDIDSIRELIRSEGFTARYGDGFSEELQNAMNSSRSKNPLVSAIRSLYEKGLSVIEFGDSVPCLWVGQGLYRHFQRQIRDEQGGQETMSEDDIRKLAMARTWSAIEMTQQSKRMENLTAAQRGGALGRFMYQFVSSPVQQMSYEIEILKELYAQVREYGINETDPELKKRFVRTVAINHIIIPALLNLAAVLAGLPLGAIPDKDELIEGIILSTVLGQFGSLFIAGAVAEEAGKAILTGKKDVFSKSGLPVSGIADAFSAVGITLHDVLTLNTEDIKSDIVELIKASGAPGRDAVRAYRNWVEGANKKAINSWND